MIPESTFWMVFPWVALVVVCYIVYWIIRGKD